ncbi:Uncharacterised protein [Mycobacterium tuberculosis]|nr:Uncharacterised protein [Mycobacterium tuberculosis]
MNHTTAGRHVASQDSHSEHEPARRDRQSGASKSADSRAGLPPDGSWRGSIFAEEAPT